MEKGAQMLFRTFARSCVLQSCVLLAASAALAQNGGRPCRGDAQKLCPEAVAARDREAAKSCLMKQMDKLSAECLAKLREAQSK